MKKWFLAVLLLVLIALVAASCGRNNRRQSAEWTPGPVSGSLAIGTRAPELVPLTEEATSAGTLTEEAILPTLAVPTAAPATAVPAAPTRDPNQVVITEADVLRSITSGAVAQEGATLDNASVDFTSDGKMILTAGRVGYGFVTADNVTLVGRLVAVGGKLELQTESVTPRGLVTSMIPTIANQALQNYTSRWYIDDVRTTDGQIELRVRP